MLSGKLPWDEGVSSDRIVLTKFTSKLFPLHKVSQYPRSTSDIVMRALHKDPTKRFDTCAQFIDELTRVLTTEEQTLFEQMRNKTTPLQEKTQSKASQAIDVVKQQRDLLQSNITKKIQEIPPRNVLEAKAQELGISFRSNWKDSTIMRKIEEAQEGLTSFVGNEGEEVDVELSYRDSLEAEATELGISFRSNWKDSTLEKKIIEEKRRLGVLDSAEEERLQLLDQAKELNLYPAYNWKTETLKRKIAEHHAGATISTSNEAESGCSGCAGVVLMGMIATWAMSFASFA